MSSTPSTVFTSTDTPSTCPVPFDQARLDDLYWSDPAAVKVTDIAAIFGVTSSEVTKLATPKPTGTRCLVCWAGAAMETRAQMTAYWLDCPTCGAACRHRVDRYEARRRAQHGENIASGVHLVGTSEALVRRQYESSPWHLGVDAHTAADALLRIGRPLDQASAVRVVEPADGLDEIRAALADRRPAVLGVPSLRALGDSQTEALQNLSQLTSDGWRIVSGTDIAVTHSVRSAEMDALSWGDPGFYDDRWTEESSDGNARQQSFGARVINATARFEAGEQW